MKEIRLEEMFYEASLPPLFSNDNIDSKNIFSVEKPSHIGQDQDSNGDKIHKKYYREDKTT